MEEFIFITLHTLFSSAMSCGIIGMGALLELLGLITFCMGATITLFFVTLSIKHDTEARYK